MSYQKWYEECAQTFGERLKVDGEFVSTRAAAQIIGRRKSGAAEFMKWFREVYSAEQEVKTTETLSISDKSKTWVDERSGMIFTDLGSDYGIISFNQGEFRSIRRDYSKHYGGGSASQTEIALRYRFPSAHAFSTFRNIHQLRQDSYPFTDTEIIEEGEDALAEKAIESRRQAAFLKMQEKDRAAEKRDAEKWRELEVNVQAIVASIKPLPLVVHTSHQPTKNLYALMVALSDLHLGKLAYDAHGNVTWNRKIAKRVALEAVDDLVSQAKQSFGHPEEIQLMICSDGTHVDSSSMTTTSGTSLGESSDGSYREIVEDYLDMVRHATERCYSVAPVKLIVVEGNHDRVTSMMIGLMLEQLYRDNDRVTVERQLGNGMVLLNYGDSTLSWMHGEYLRGNKGAQLWPAIVATAREKGMVLQPNALSWSGHLHHENVTDLGGIVHHTLPALCASDEFHRRGLWQGSRECAQAFVIERSGGKRAVLYSDSVMRRSA